MYSHTIVFTAGFDNAKDSVLCKELVSLLAITDLSYSELLNHLPQKSGTDIIDPDSNSELGLGEARISTGLNFAEVTNGGSVRTSIDNALKTIAEFHSPKFEAAKSTLSQGKFSLKGTKIRNNVYNKIYFLSLFDYYTWYI